MKEMEKTILFLENELKINAKDVIVLGCSGGPDSMALFDILLGERKKFAFTIICAHVNHNVREESKQEEENLRIFCKKNDVVFETKKIEQYNKDNFHNDARVIRYDFFEKIIEKYNANYLMTAHHGDDLVETVLMRLVRGSDINGYRGFDIVTNHKNYKTVRPLVFYTKQQLQQYDDEHNICYAMDYTNFSDEYTRNRYRNHVLPFLKKENSDVHLKFIKYNRLLKMYSEYVEQEADKIYSDICSSVQLNIGKYLLQPDAIKYLLLNKWLYGIYGDNIVVVNDRHTQKINDIILSGKSNATINLPNNITLIKDYKYLRIKSRDNSQEEKAKIIENGTQFNNGIFNYVDDIENNDNSTCKLIKDEIKLPLYVRTRMSGDKIELRNSGHRKINDIFIDCKISINERERLPIVVDSNDNIIWIPGVKKSKFCRKKDEDYDIIIRYNKQGGYYG